MDTNMEIGEGIKFVREIIGATQSDLAEAVGITLSYVSLIESGDRMPKVLVLNNIAAALGLKMWQLIAICEGDELSILDIGKVNTTVLLIDGLKEMRL